MTPDEVVDTINILEKLKNAGCGNNYDGSPCRVRSKEEYEALTTAITLLQDYQKLLDREKKWQDMCNKHVGCSMLADEFAGEPHEPEEFGGYVDNLEQQAEDYQKLRERIDEGKITEVVRKTKYVGMVKHYELVPDWCKSIAQSIVTYLGGGE